MQKVLFEKEEKKEKEIVKTELLTFIDIFREDLHDFIFREDGLGRYRERIIKNIETFGVKNWFVKMGFPLLPESIWKSRYCGTEITLNEDLTKWGERVYEKGFDFDKHLEAKGYYTWENYLPKESWNDKQLDNKYKVGTSEYYARLKEDSENKKKYEKADLKKKEVKIEGDLFGVKLPEKHKVIIEEGYSYDENFNLTEDFEVSCENFGYHSSGGEAGTLMKEGKYKEALEYVVNYFRKMYPTAEFVHNPRTEEKKAEMLKTITERKSENLKYLEKDIETKSKELKNLLKKKFGYPVIIRVLKDEGVK